MSVDDIHIMISIILLNIRSLFGNPLFCGKIIVRNGHVGQASGDEKRYTGNHRRCDNR